MFQTGRRPVTELPGVRCGTIPTCRSKGQELPGAALFYVVAKLATPKSISFQMSFGSFTPYPKHLNYDAMGPKFLSRIAHASSLPDSGFMSHCSRSLQEI